MGRMILLMLALAFVGCERDPLPVTCVSGLVVTELSRVKGDEWVEIAVVADRPQDLLGLNIEAKNLDGSALRIATVREASGLLPPGSRVVVDHLEQLSGRTTFLPESGILELVACGEVLDRLTWRKMPDFGSLALSGSAPLDPVGNDDERLWCATDTPTKGQENPPCQ